MVDPDTGAESNDGKQNARITDFQDDVSTEEYINVSLEDLARRYKDYLGENICVTGIAVDMVGNINISNMDGIYICINGDFDIKPLSGDTITVYGKVVEDDFFKNTPAIDAVKVDIFY